MMPLLTTPCFDPTLTRMDTSVGCTRVHSRRHWGQRHACPHLTQRYPRGQYVHNPQTISWWYQLAACTGIVIRPPTISYLDKKPRTHSNHGPNWFLSSTLSLKSNRHATILHYICGEEVMWVFVIMLSSCSNEVYMHFLHKVLIRVY